MSIFDIYDNFLPGDSKVRKVETSEEFIIEEEGLEEKPQKQFWPFYLIALMIMGFLVAQLVNLQVTQGSANRYLAEGNRIREREIKAPRGKIYDKNNALLVDNTVSYSLEIYPLDLPKNEKERREYYQKLSDIVQMPTIEIEKTIKERAMKSDTVVLKENLDRDTAMLLEIKTANMPGVLLGKNPVRDYKPVTGLSQIIGYVGKVTDQELEKNANYSLDEIIGKEGLEKNYQEFLRGKEGINQIEVDSKGRAQRFLANLPPKPGDSLTLAIDAELEQKLADILGDKMYASDSPGGAAVIMDVKTGGIIAMVSLPTYDNNVFTKGNNQEYAKLLNDESRPMFNRAISGNYPSGSTIKPLVAAAGLQDGIITENTTIDDPGEIEVGSWAFPDWKNHGLVDVRKAIAESCNVFFYSLGGGWDKIRGLGVNKLREYMEKFGLGSSLGIDLPGEAKGLLPSPEWKEKSKKESWYLGDTYHMAIGQGDVLATPLQMAAATSSVANGGELLKPYIVQKIKSDSGEVVKDRQKEVIRSNVVEARNLEIVREGMRQAVTSGSARALNDLPVMAAAKTGTAQFGGEGKTHAWMVAFAPYEDPQIAMAVIVEAGGEGYAAAGPVVEDVFYWFFSR